MRAGKWPLMLKLRIEQYLNFVRSRLISVLVFCVTWLRTWKGVTLIVVYLLKEHANTGFRFWQLFDRYRKYVGAGVDRSPVRGYFLFVFVIFHVLHCIDYLYYECIFRSTPKSRPNNMGQMSVRTSVRPSTKSFSDSDEIWYVGRGRWVMHDGMPCDSVMSPLNFEIL